MESPGPLSHPKSCHLQVPIPDCPLRRFQGNLELGLDFIQELGQGRGGLLCPVERRGILGEIPKFWGELKPPVLSTRAESSWDDSSFIFPAPTKFHLIHHS